MNAKNILTALVLLFFQTSIIAQAPSWTINPINYQYSASMVAQLNVDGVLSTDNNFVAVFVGNEVRGLGWPLPNTNGLYFISIYSNIVAGETLTLKTYLFDENLVVPILEEFTFAAYNIWGDPDMPVQLHAWSDGDVPIALDAVPAQLAIRPGTFLPVEMQGYLQQQDNDPIVWTATSSANLTASFIGSILTVTPNNPIWSGTQVITVTATEQTPNQYSASRSVNFTVLPAYYQPEWDSIPSQAIDTTQVFASFDLDDYILETYAGTCLDFGYKIDEGFATGSDPAPVWSVNPSNFSYSMTVVGEAAYTPDYLFSHPGDRLGAFIGDQLAGVAEPVQVSGSPVFFLTVFANAVDSVSFRFFSAEKNNVYRLPHKLLFQISGEVGNIDVPKLLDFSPLGMSIGSGNVVNVTRRDPQWKGLLSFHFSVAECAYPALSNDTIVANFSVGLVEICDGIDNDGDTHVDEMLRFWYVPDLDGDGYGDEAVTATLSCPNLPNTSLDSTDCDDANALIHPGATEVCNNTDDDCDALTDSDDPSIVDLTPPSALCNNLTVYLDGNGQASTTVAALNNGSSDACGIETVALNQTSFDCSHLGANTLTLTVTDKNGLVSTCNPIVTVQDSIPPTIGCQNITIGFNASAVTSYAPADVFNAAASSDNCNSSITLLNALPSSFTCNQVGQNLVTLTAQDSYGNIGTCTAIVTVQPFVNVSSVTLVQPECGSFNGSVSVVASAILGQLAYSINGGTTWSFDGSFTDLAAGPDTVLMQVFSSGVGCVAPPVPFILSEIGGTPWYQDADADSYSNGTSYLACTQPSGWYAAGSLIATSGDCNDNNAAINPAAIEVCNGMDDDCSGSPEAIVNTWTGNGGSNLWSNAANWSDGRVPLACQDVVLPAGIQVTVPAGFQGLGRTLTVALSANLTVELTGTMEIQN